MMNKTPTQTQRLIDAHNESMRWQLPDESEEEYLSRMETQSDRGAWYDQD